MLRLNISQQYSRIGLDIQKPQINLKTTLPQTQIENQPASVEISQPRGELTIDQTPCRYSLGIKNNTDFMRDIAREGMRTAFETIGRMAQDGDRLAEFQTGDAIAELAQAATTPPPIELTINPIESPIIQYVARPAQFNPMEGQLNISLKRGTVENNFQRGQVNLYMIQYAKVTMWTTGSMDMKA